MIQLYKASNTNYAANGDRVLWPSSCLLDMTLNGDWELELEYPLADAYLDIVEGAVLAVPAPGREKQLFRIYKAIRGSDGITTYARPVFWDSANEVFLVDVRPTEKSGQEALNILTNGTKYRGSSNIARAGTAYYVNKNLMEALSSDDENSFLNRWGGEIYYDNYTVYINERIGGDYGVTARFGRNLESIEETVDMSEVITRIIPVAYNGYMLEGNQPWVDSERIGNYPIVYARKVTYSDIKMAEDAGEDETGYETEEQLREALKVRAKADFAAGCDLPNIAYKVSMVDLAQTDEYADVEILETVGLGDTVHCSNKRLNISTSARCTRIVYDCIRKRNSKIELGDYQGDYFSRLDTDMSLVGGVIDTGSGTVMAEKVAGILNGMNVSLRAQSTVARKAGERAILFEDLDESSPTYGAMCLGTKGFEISDRRTVDGRDWDWQTAFTAKGGRADAIITGLLSDQGAKNYWNLETGEFRLAASATVGGKTVSDIAKAAVDAQTQTDIFNKLTSNGVLQGIFMDAGKLYINATYMVSGLLKDKTGKSYWNLDTGEFYTATGTFSGKLVGATGDFSGKITAKSGSIGGNSITDTNIEIVGEGLIIGMDAHIMKRTAQDEIFPIIASYTGNNPSIMLNAPGNEVHIGVYNTTGIISEQHHVFENGYTNASTEKIKDDIRALTLDPLQVIANSTVWEYYMKRDLAQGKKCRKYGFVVERNSPEQVLSYDHHGVDVYSAVGILWAAVQRLMSERTVKGNAKTNKLSNP